MKFCFYSFVPLLFTYSVIYPSGNDIKRTRRPVLISASVVRDPSIFSIPRNFLDGLNNSSSEDTINYAINHFVSQVTRKNWKNMLACLYSMDRNSLIKSQILLSLDKKYTSEYWEKPLKKEKLYRESALKGVLETHLELSVDE